MHALKIERRREGWGSKREPGPHQVNPVPRLAPQFFWNFSKIMKYTDYYARLGAAEKPGPYQVNPVRHPAFKNSERIGNVHPNRSGEVVTLPPSAGFRNRVRRTERGGEACVTPLAG